MSKQGAVFLKSLNIAQGVTVHSFPNPRVFQERFRIWVGLAGASVSGLTNMQIYANRKVCDRHFAEKYKNRNSRLNATAIPHLHISRLTLPTLATKESFRPLRSIQNVLEAISSKDLEAPGHNKSLFEETDSSAVQTTSSEDLSLPDNVYIFTQDHHTNTLDIASEQYVEAEVCRVCLALDVKMYDLKDIELREMFQNITGIVVTENNHSILEHLCWECAGRLKAAAAFRNKALLSDALLQGLANTGKQIRKNDVTCIKENQDYLKSAGTLSIVEVFHTVEIDAEYESVPSISENNDTDIVQITVRKMDVEDESKIEAPIRTEIEYDPIGLHTGEENRNIVLETNPLFSNNISLREDTINSAYSSLPPGCSHVEPKYSIHQTPSDFENKIKKTVVKITNRDSVSKIMSKKSKEVINHDHTLKGDAKLKNVNLKVGGISKKTLNQKLVKKSQVKANTPTDEEYLSL